MISQLTALLGGIAALVLGGAAAAIYAAGYRQAMLEVEKQNVKAKRAASEVMAESRTTSDTADKLRDGTF